MRANSSIIDAISLHAPCLLREPSERSLQFFLGGVGGCTFDLKIILGEFLISKVELGAQFQVQFGLLMMLPVFLVVLACVI